MSRKIKITAGNVEVSAVLYDNEMAENIWEALPFSGQGRTWGEEIYFPISTEQGKGERKQIVDVGELGFWDQGNAFCIFFGPTPSSSGDKPCAASPVTLFGKIEGNAKKFNNVPGGTEVQVTRLEK